MNRSEVFGPLGRGLVLACALVLAVATRPAVAQTTPFSNIPVWAYPGAWQGGADSVREQPRTITVRWLRDPNAEARAEFGGYRIYRATNIGDTTNMVLVRRFSRQSGDSLVLWHFPRIDASTPEAQRIVTFIDPDSNGSFQKVCRRVDNLGRCLTRGDSILKLVAPPGPHDGFRVWYSITYEAFNLGDNDFLDMFIPDRGDCTNPADTATCVNRNNKAANVSNDVDFPRDGSSDPDSLFFSHAVEPTGAPEANLERVGVVPNPYRATEAWNPAGGNELHFINLPPQATIRIYTVSGELVVKLDHADTVRDFERWDLKNQSGRDVSSGIYMYRIESGSFAFQDRFVVIR